MQEREEICSELWARLAAVPGMNYTARNPKKKLEAENCPAAQFFELGDVVEEQRMRGDLPAYKRKLEVVVEVFVKATVEAASTQELIAFVKEVKKKIYEGGASLGSRCSIVETEASRILRPDTGEHVAGVGLAFAIRYVESVKP